MRNTLKFVIALLVLVGSSCTKEELYEPIEYEKVEESTKATSLLGAGLSITLKKSQAEYDELGPNATVKFKGRFWSVIRKRSTNGRTVSQIWSSRNGLDWVLRKTNPFPVSYPPAMVVNNGVLFVLLRRHSDYPSKVWSSRDGLIWMENTSSNPAPFNNLVAAVSFNNKIYVFNAVEYGYKQEVYSSADGAYWHLENSNAFSARYNGKSLVFKNAIYYIGGVALDATSRSHQIWKSTNGSDWHLVKTPKIPPYSSKDKFPGLSSHAAVSHKGKVWVVGGIGTDNFDENDYYDKKDIWYSSDMKNWTKYEERKLRPSLRPMTNATLLSNKDELLLLGGRYAPRSTIINKKIWSIKGDLTAFWDTIIQ